MNIAAFVGHSFNKEDASVVRQFCDFFDSLNKLHPGFTWESAKDAEPKTLAEKVRERMQNKDLFIGICTHKEYAIDPKDIKSFRSTKEIKIDKDKLQSKTSDWIIQESAYSVGQGKNILLLIEEGVRNPDVFQSNREYIPFDRNNPEAAFIKINQMLASLNKDKLPTLVQPQITAKENTVNKEQQVPEFQLEPQKNWEENDYHRALVVALSLNDKNNATSIFNSYLKNQTPDENKKIIWKAKYTYNRFIFGEEDAFHELTKLLHEYPDNSEINYYLGKIYEDFSNYNKAIEYIKKSVSCSINLQDKFEKTQSLAILLFKRNDSAAYDVLSEIIDLAVQIDNAKISLLFTLAEIFKITKQDVNYLATLETILSYRPDMHDERFNLAYKYSKTEANDDLALFHYKIIATLHPNPNVYNNIGVAQSRLALPCKAISSYRMSEKLGGTWAMKNISYKLLDVGFVTEAKDLVRQVLNKENFDLEISSVLSEINQKEESEKNKEKEILEQTDKKRNFYIRYMESYIRTTTNLEALNGIWESDNNTIEIQVNGKRFGAKGKVSLPNYLSGLAASISGNNNLKDLVRNIIYTGTIHGLTIEYDKIEEVEKNNKPLSLLDLTPIPIKGLMIISDNLQRIEIYEKNSGASKFFVLKKSSFESKSTQNSQQEKTKELNL